MTGNQPLKGNNIIFTLQGTVGNPIGGCYHLNLVNLTALGESGQPFENPPTLWDIESDPKLASTKLIAEAWDAAGLYQVGSFIGDRWTEWNGGLSHWSCEEYASSDSNRNRTSMASPENALRSSVMCPGLSG